jgi:uncharacterized membrane protein YhaH (DUF805 family)
LLIYSTPRAGADLEFWMWAHTSSCTAVLCSSWHLLGTVHTCHRTTWGTGILVHNLCLSVRRWRDEIASRGKTVTLQDCIYLFV